MKNSNKFYIGDFVLINNKNIGIIEKIIWNHNGYIVKLEDQPDYIDKTLKQYNLINFDKSNNILGYMLVSLNDQLIKIDLSNLDILTNIFDDKKFVDKLIKKIKNIFCPESSNFDNFDNFNGDEIKKKNTIYKTEKFNDYRIQSSKEDDYVKYINKIINNLFIDDINIKWEEDFYLGSESISTLGEENIQDVIKPGFVFTLEKFNPIEPEQQYDLKNTLGYKYLIYDDNIDTVSFGKELIGMIKNSLLEIQQSIKFDDGEKLLSVTNLFDFLNFKIVGAHIEITNANYDSNGDFRIITNELVSDLNELAFQIDKPIDYNILIPIVLKNKTYPDVIINKSTIFEALRILSQEYIICLQPNVEVLLWVISRLILCWYSDNKLYSNIYKIKILINLFRSRGNKEFNKDHGVLPIIQILPKYGKKNAMKILSHLSYWFFPYKKLGCEYCSPSWFDKIDDLMYYTNGSLELKKYIKYLSDNNETFNNPLSKDMVQINLSNENNKLQYTL